MEISLDQFMDQLRSYVDAFEANWREGMGKKGDEKFPETMTSGADWFEQFLIWVEHG